LSDWQRASHPRSTACWTSKRCDAMVCDA
jgi:hypothetical protein